MFIVNLMGSRIMDDNEPLSWFVRDYLDYIN